VTIRAAYRLLIESEQESGPPRSIVVDAYGVEPKVHLEIDGGLISDEPVLLSLTGDEARELANVLLKAADREIDF